MPQPRRIHRDNSSVPAVVDDVLKSAGMAMRVVDIHAAADELVAGRVAKFSVTNALVQEASRECGRFERVSRGRYQLRPEA